MKAVIAHEFNLDTPMTVEEREDPTPGPGEILVKIAAVGVNPSEIATRTGKHAYSRMVTPPYIPGHEAAGEIIALGEGVKEFQKGQHVLGRAIGGAYAELARFAAATAMRVPESFSDAQGAGFSVPFMTAWNALIIKAKAGPGETVLVQGGAGGVGMASIQVAKRMGCRVLATVSSDEKAAFCKKLGAGETINYREENVAQRCMDLTGGRGVEVIVEMIACENFDKDLDAICVNGRIVIVGTGTGKGPMAEFRVPAAMTRDAHILGITGINLRQGLPEVVRRITPLAQAGAFEVHVDSEIPFADSNAAHELVLSGKFLGKVVLVP